MGVFGLSRICKSVTIRGPSDYHSRFVLWRCKDFFFSSHTKANLMKSPAVLFLDHCSARIVLQNSWPAWPALLAIFEIHNPHFSAVFFHMNWYL